ncbi:LytR/AlgR family response regulator transcription factor [Phenylobacterium sp.]|uniref:LytR/AlgR family response regulator transcription factor n=1 Tax=Phenylobacterium sp. TaxID=1871053 RepID=UPI00391DBF49
MLIVDDEPLAADWLARCLSGWPDMELVGTAPDAEAARALIAELRPDLVFLDIQMPGESGMTLARAMSETRGPEIVFVTAFAEHAAEAFEIEAVDYLLKPVQPDRLAEAVRRARRRRESRSRDGEEVRAQAAEAPPADGYDEELWVRRRDGFVRVRVSQILRIEAARDYALIHTAAKTYIQRTTMAELAGRLDPAELMRVHRSAFVRLSTVARVERGGRNLMRLHTEDGAAVEVGVSYARKVAEALGLDRAG